MTDNPEEYTSVRVKRKTLAKLAEKISKSESYDDGLWRILTS